MALPTYGRVIIDTTVGELDIELWTKVDISEILVSLVYDLILFTGSTKGMPELNCIGHGRYDLLDLSFQPTKFYLGYYDGVIFHRYVGVAIQAQAKF